MSCIMHGRDLHYSRRNDLREERQSTSVVSVEMG